MVNRPAISEGMRIFHEQEENKVVPITKNQALTGGFRRDNWLKELPVGTNFLTFEGGMYLTEWTILGRRGDPVGQYVLLREDIFEEGLNKSNCKWVNSSLFSLQNELKEIL